LARWTDPWRVFPYGL
jgi:hypothetical protein